jgi:acyl dehydratase
MVLYLEDLPPGRVFSAGPITIDESEVLDFARRFDPQPFHLDAEAARDSLFAGLAASGWHTASLCMRAAVESELGSIANGLVGIEVRHLHWPVPTRPGDVLRLQAEVLDTTPSRSRPGWGTARVAWTARNQRDQIALRLEYVGWVARRPGPGPI